MLFDRALAAVALTAFLVTPTLAVAMPQRGGGGRNRGGDASAANSAAAAASSVAAASNGTATTGGNNNDANVLNPANVQTGSQSDGQAASGAAAGQAPSQTDAANFINFCTGKTITNGLQVKAGSCNGIVMGDIPASTDMVSSIIVNPALGDNVQENTTFDVKVQTSGLAAGTFTNPTVTYYAAPQFLSGGKIVGHTHVTIQTLGGSLNPSNPPDPSTFVFFKGINDAGDGNGLLKATVTGGLPAGNYRVCTMAASSNHQPVLMPVAQRGAQDDCTKFTVGAGGGGNGGATGGGGSAATSSAASSATAVSSAAASASTSAAAQNTNKGSTGGQGGRGGKGGKGAKCGKNKE